MPLPNSPHSLMFSLLVVLLISVIGCSHATHPRRQVSATRPRGPRLPEVTSAIADPHHSGEMAFSPDGKTLALPGPEGRVELCDLATGRSSNLADPRMDGTMSRKAVFSRNGRFLAVEYQGRAIMLWEIPTGNKLLTIPLDQYTGVHDMTFTDGDGVLAAMMVKAIGEMPVHHTWDVFARRWEVPSGKILGSVDFGGELLFKTFSPDGRYALFEIRSGKSAVFDVATRAKLFGLDGPASRIFLTDSSAVVSCYRGRISIHDVPSGKVRRQFEIASMVPDPGLDVSSDGKLLAVARWPEFALASLISLESGKLLATVECGPPSMMCDIVRLSPDGRFLATDTFAGDATDHPATPLLKLWRIPDAW